MKIACDIDEVIVEWVRGYFKFVESKGVDKVDYDDIFTFELCDVLGIDKKWSYDLADEFYFHEDFQKIDFVEGAFESVKKLIKNFDLYFITARPKISLKITRDFIFDKFSVLGDRVIFSGDVYSNQGKSKVDICKDMGIDLIIEDNGKYSLSYAESGIKVLLLDKPWNRNYDHKNIYRCKNWDEVLEKIAEFENGRVV